jgi:hypothetical protein
MCLPHERRADWWMLKTQLQLIPTANVRSEARRSESGGLDKVTPLRSETISKFVIVSEISKTIW